MSASIHHTNETTSNTDRDVAAKFEPKSLRTYTPSQAVLAKSSGVFHWTPEGRKLFDFSSGVLVANLGHNPMAWMQKFTHYMGWPGTAALGLFTALPHGLQRHHATRNASEQTPADLLQSRPGGKRLQQVMWAASGPGHSESVGPRARSHARDDHRHARWHHGKKGLAGAVTGSRPIMARPRVRFISFP